jgi:hypothetical protein
MDEELTRGAFTRSLRSVFRIEAPPTDLELIEVGDLAGARPEASDRSFSLLFRGPVSAMLPQGTYTVSHEAFGSFALFLVPVARAEDGFRYEAIFNRV